MTGQSLYATDTAVVTYADVSEVHPKAWAALCEWLRFHSIDPNDVPAAGVIRRDVDRRCVHYGRIVRDEHGKPVPVQVLGQWTYQLEDAVAQGETPPLPWPPNVAALPLDPRTDPALEIP